MHDLLDLLFLFEVLLIGLFFLLHLFIHLSLQGLFSFIAFLLLFCFDFQHSPLLCFFLFDHFSLEFRFINLSSTQKYKLIHSANLLLRELFGSLLIQITLLDLLLQSLYLFVLVHQFLQLDAATNLLVFSSLQLLSQLVLWNLEVYAVVSVLRLLLVEWGWCHFVTYNLFRLRTWQ